MIQTWRLNQPIYVGFIIIYSFDQLLVDTGMWVCQKLGSKPLYEIRKENTIVDHG